jgi:Domain of unknown function (DUF4360)
LSEGELTSLSNFTTPIDLLNLENLIMKLLHTCLTGAVLLAVTSGQALATSAVSIQGAGYGGNGCPAGSASVNVSPDGQELSILFDKFVADKNQRRASCNLTIPIKVPQGFQISLYNADYRGYVAPQTRARLRSEYFFAGHRGPVTERTFRGEIDYNVRDRLATMADVWSACGDSVNMRINSSMTAMGQGSASVDSFDLAHKGMVYHVAYRPCR